jgi:creatine kinase
MLRRSGAARDWPDGRGVFLNEKDRWAVWANEEDHVRFVTVVEGRVDPLPALERVFCLVRGVEVALEARGAGYMRHVRYGCLTTSPLNVGTGLRLTATVQSPGIKATVSGRGGRGLLMCFRSNRNKDEFIECPW